MQSRERSKNYQEQNKPPDEFTTEMSVSPASSFQTHMEKKRALDQTKNVLPQTLEKKVEIVENLVKSPRTRKALQKKGVVKSPEEEKEHLKPYSVKAARERDRRSCLCRKHKEVRLVFNECVKVRKNLLRDC